jgi:UDP-2,3-diacylglucosamine pyrophosphatase LpxH
VIEFLSCFVARASLRSAFMQHFDLVVISDVHLGAKNSQAIELLRFLNAIQTDHLVINGDLFEDPQLRGLNDDHIAVLDAIRRHDEQSQLTILRGNHDPDEHWFRTVFGFPLRDEILVDIGQKKYLICHGHEWDRAMQLPRWLIRGADCIYNTAQRIDPTHGMAKFLKRRCKTFVRAAVNMRLRAMQVAVERNLDGVITGHTHLIEEDRSQGVHYINSGCWTEHPTSYLAARRGEIKHYTWHGKLYEDLPVKESAANHLSQFNYEHHWERNPWDCELAAM